MNVDVTTYGKMENAREDIHEQQEGLVMTQKWKYYGKKGFARDARTDELKELHLCRNPQMEFVFCETNIHFKECSGECQ